MEQNIPLVNARPGSNLTRKHSNRIASSIAEDVADTTYPSCSGTDIRIGGKQKHPPDNGVVANLSIVANRNVCGFEVGAQQCNN